MKFKVLDWVRKIRDEDYEKTKNISPKEKIEYIKKAADKFANKKLEKLGK